MRDLARRLADSSFPVGLAYPLYNVFLPQYLRTRGAQLGGLSEYEQWRNYAIANACGIRSPILAGLMCRSGWFWGRRGESHTRVHASWVLFPNMIAGTMIIGTILTMAFLFAYTQVKNNAQNAGFTSAINFCLVRIPLSYPTLLIVLFFSTAGQGNVYIALASICLSLASSQPIPTSLMK